MSELIHVGYAHESLLGLRPDVRHPGRNLKRPACSVTKITSAPCGLATCADPHVEVWVRRVPRKKLKRLRRDQ